MGDLPSVIFSSEPSSFFHVVLRMPRGTIKVLIKNALQAPFDELKNIGYLSYEELTEIKSGAYGPADEQISKPEFLDELFNQTVKRFSNSTAIVCGKNPYLFHAGLAIESIANALLQMELGPETLSVFC